MRSRRWFGAVLTILGMAAVLAAGSGLHQASAQSATPVATPVAGAIPCTNLFGIALGNACALVLHGAAQMGPIDVYVDGQLVLEGATFGVLNDFVPVTAGERQIQIVPSGDAVENAVIDTTVGLADGVAYEAAALGSAEDVRLQVLPVDTRPLPEDGSRLRVIHASPDAPAIDIVVTGGDTVIEDLEGGEVSEYVDLPAGTYDLEARVAGTTDLALPLPGTVLAPNTVYSVYVTGLVEEGSLGATLVPVLVSPDIAGVAATPVP